MTVSDLRVLVENLDEYIHIPNGIERLRKTVLHLAVSGQLVPQDPSEGTGEDLYKQIQSKHAIKKPLPEITETPFDIPKGWKWVNLAEIVNIKIGKTPSRTEPKYWGNDIPWVSIADLSDGNHILDTKEKVSSLGLEKCFKGTISPAGTLLYSFKLTIGKMSIIDMDSVHNEAIASLITYSPITTEYLFKALKIIDPLSKTNSAVMGKTLNSQTLAIIEVPLPPLDEQKRIIERVNEIFALMDELSDRYKAEEAERSKLVKSSLRTFSHEGSKLALDNLTSIIKTKADAAELRKAILHLAISGKLVPQDPKEGTGEELYRQIQSAKSEINLKKQKLLPEITDEELPFDIPESWKWVRLAEVYDVRDGTHDTPKYTPKGYALVTSKNLSSGKLSFDNVQFISQDDYLKIKERSGVSRNDILFAMIGSIGNPVIVDTNEEFAIKNVALFKPIGKYYNPDWLLNILRLFTDAMKKQSAGGVQSFVSLSFLRNYPMPLPPLEEQERIVKKTTELLSLVDELEQHLEQ